MAYTLLSSGIATNLLMCVAIDSDGTTIKEFVSSDVNSNKTVTSVAVGASSWKGTNRGYFQTSGSGSSPNSVQFPSGHRPVWNVVGPGGGGDGGAFFMALAGSTATQSGGNDAWLVDDNGIGIISRHTNNTVLELNGAARSGATTIPSDGTTKFSAGANYAAFTDWQIYYGLESGSLAQDATGSDAGSLTTTNITGIGGWTGFYSGPAKYHVVCLFNRSLTLVEMQSLHNDWFGTLFDPGGGPVTVAAGGSASTSAAGTAAPVFSIGL